MDYRINGFQKKKKKKSSIQEAIYNGSSKRNLAEVWQSFSALCDDKQREIVRLFLADCELFLGKVITEARYTEDATRQETVSNLLSSLAFHFLEPFDPTKLLNLTAFSHFITHHSFNMAMLFHDLHILNQANTNDANLLLIPVKDH